ncbi:MAG: UDP-N-acetylmuramate dehydrogenase [Pseudomonadota bacterium]
MTSVETQSVASLESEVRGTLLRDEPMANHTSWRVGGNADYFFVPADEEDLRQVLANTPETLDLHWIGLGSNLLVRDGGIRGMVICTTKGLGQLHVDDSGVLNAQAGATCAKVARQTVRAGFTGAEFLAGVPGTFGGALAMNAGAFGGETWERVTAIRCCDRKGTLIEPAASDVNWGYRNVELSSEWCILSATMQLDKSTDSPEQGQSRIRQLLRQRGESQPVQSANAGSVFRNPENDYAARLLEAGGLKGTTIGDAEYSTKHANFIINRGRATASDIEQLIQLGQEMIADKFGVQLQPEVRIVGIAT